MLRPYGVPDDESGFTKSDFVSVADDRTQGFQHAFFGIR